MNAPPNNNFTIHPQRETEDYYSFKALSDVQYVIPPNNNILLSSPIGALFTQSDSPHALSTRVIFPLIFDSGASYSLTPVKSDFITAIKPPKINTLHGIGHSNKVEGEGTVEWRLTDVKGHIISFTTFALYLPSSHVCLFSPQFNFFETKDGSFYMDKNHSVFKPSSTSHPVIIPYNVSNNIPMNLHDMTHHQRANDVTVNLQIHKHPVCIQVAENYKSNLSLSQKELLLWHCRLGHVNLQLVQLLLRKRN